MLLPAAVRPYAADVDGTASRVRCAIVLNGSKELHIHLCGRLKRGLFGRNQLLADGDVLCVALHQPDGDVPLFDSRCDGYANVLDGKQPPAPIPLHPAICPKCRNAAFQLRLTFEYPEAEELAAFANPDDMFTWVWLSLRCTRVTRCFGAILQLIDFNIHLDFIRCSRRLCGGEDVTFCCDRKVPKHAQRGLKRVQVWTSPAVKVSCAKERRWRPCLTAFPCVLVFKTLLHKNRPAGIFHPGRAFVFHFASITTAVRRFQSRFRGRRSAARRPRSR